MSSEHILVTGALGCIGAWVVRHLVAAGVAVTVFDLSNKAYRMQLIMGEEDIARVRFIVGDIADPQAVTDTVAASGATTIIHLAALQIPACRANPTLGAQVNVVGTVNVFEAARKAGHRRLVYASSAAVYGPVEEYPPGPLADDAPLLPRSLYGVFKQADEGIARVYWHEHGISSIGLRPYVVYGPGRDQGLTSSPTKAMLAAAAGAPYHIAYGGHFDMQYAGDVARSMIAALHVPFDGSRAFNLGGTVAHMADVVAAITRAAPASRGQISFDEKSLGYPEAMDGSAARAVLGDLSVTPLDAGVAETVATFRRALDKGLIAP